jgi:hypothetical protein
VGLFKTEQRRRARPVIIARIADEQVVPVADHDCIPDHDAAAQLRKQAEDRRTLELIRLSAEHAARACPEDRSSQTELNAAAEWAHRAREERARTHPDWAGVERRKSGLG